MRCAHVIQYIYIDIVNIIHAGGVGGTSDSGISSDESSSEDEDDLLAAAVAAIEVLLAFQTCCRLTPVPDINNQL